MVSELRNPEKSQCLLFLEPLLLPKLWTISLSKFFPMTFHLFNHPIVLMENNLLWSQVVQTKLKGKGKLNHLIGPQPSKEDPKFEAWDIKDSLIMSWLWIQCNQRLMKIVYFLLLAKIYGTP